MDSENPLSRHGWDWKIRSGFRIWQRSTYFQGLFLVCSFQGPGYILRFSESNFANKMVCGWRGLMGQQMHAQNGANLKADCNIHIQAITSKWRLENQDPANKRTSAAFSWERIFPFSEWSFFTENIMFFSLSLYQFQSGFQWISVTKNRDFCRNWQDVNLESQIYLPRRNTKPQEEFAWMSSWSLYPQGSTTPPGRSRTALVVR